MDNEKDALDRSEEFIEVPILDNFDASKHPIGTVKILKSSLPEKPTWLLSIGYTTDDVENHRESKYKLVSLSIVEDSAFIGYLKQEKLI